MTDNNPATTSPPTGRPNSRHASRHAPPIPPTDILPILSGCRRRDPESESKLIKAFRIPVRSGAKAGCPRRDLFDDAEQEAWIAIFLYIYKLDDDDIDNVQASGVSSLFYQIARRTAIDHSRMQRGQEQRWQGAERREREPLYPGSLPDKKQPEPSHQYDFIELLDDLEATLSLLPDRDREIFNRVWIRGEMIGEAGNAVGLCESAIHNTIKHYAEAIRSNMPATWRGGPPSRSPRSVLLTIQRKERGRFLTFRGRTQDMEAWGREIGINPHTIRNRLNKGMSVTEALSRTVPGRRRFLLDYATAKGRPGDLRNYKAGICIKCKDAPAPDMKTMCDACRRGRADQMKERYRERTSRGLCPKCAMPVVEGKSYCRKCMERILDCCRRANRDRGREDEKRVSCA